MSESFEDKLKDRLDNYQVPPPANAKAAILGKPVVVTSYAYLYRYIGALLLLISLIQIGYREQGSEDISLDNTQTDECQLKNDLIDRQSVLVEDDSICDPEGDTNSMVAGVVKNENIDTEVNQPDLINVEPAKDPTTLLRASNDSFFSNEEKIFLPHDLESLVDKENMISANSLILENKYDPIDHVIPEGDKVIKLYFETGAFFLYNRLKPNLDDDIFLSDYDAPFGLSVSRIGLAVNLGVQGEVSERMTLKLGMVYNNYNQIFSFAIRKTQPDSLTAVADSDFFEPIFHSEKVDINKRISTLGGRIQAVWAVPSKFNAILSSFEYHRMLGNGAQFTYEGLTHSLSQKNQFIFEIGLQKLLYESRKAHLSLIPSLRYSVNKLGSVEALSVKPFSVGVSISYELK